MSHTVAYRGHVFFDKSVMQRLFVLNVRNLTSVFDEIDGILLWYHVRRLRVARYSRVELGNGLVRCEPLEEIVNHFWVGSIKFSRLGVIVTD